MYGLVTGRLRERLLPIRVRDVVGTVRDTLRFHIDHSDLTTYNAVQKLLYIVVILAGRVAGRHGVGDLEAGAVLGPHRPARRLPGRRGWSTSRGMSVIVGFLVVHVALSLLVPQTLWAMLAGGPRLHRTRSGVPAGGPPWRPAHPSRRRGT